MRFNPGFVIQGPSPQQATERAVAWQSPALPHMGSSEVARWHAVSTWTPPGTRTLVRHTSPDGTRLVTSERVSPRGFHIEYDLGVVHVHGQPGTQRILRTPDGFLRTAMEGRVGDGYAELGHVEQAAFPMLTPLEVRRVPGTGQLTLVSGHDDPLFAIAEHVETVGFIDGFPVEPRRVNDQRGLRNTIALWRTLPPDAVRHGYASGSEPEFAVAALGGIWNEPRNGFVPLERRADGVVATSLLAPERRRAFALKPLARWVAAPLAWSDARVPQAWGVRASGGRLRMVAGQLPPRRGTMVEPETLGYIRVEPRRCWKPLFSATHEVTGDQFLTRSDLEARDMGYRVDGILGYVAEHAVDPARIGLEHEVLWASRFGQRRRYLEPS